MKGNRWSTFNAVTTDFSIALINAICFSLNSLSLINYKNKIYEHINLELIKDNKLVDMRLCCVHLIKNVVVDFNKFYKNKDVKNEIIEIFVSIYDHDFN